MPVYNSELYVREAIQSVLEQTCTSFELVIVDDGSTDGSVDAVNSVRDDRIRLIEKPVNSGLAAARNTALEEAQGNYIAWLDSDDRARSSRLETQVDFLERHPDVGLCGGWVETFGQGRRHRWQYPTESTTLKCRMIFDDPFATSSVMLRREALDGIGGHFDMAFPPAEDYELWDRIGQEWELANIDSVLVDYRVHDNQTSVLHSVDQMDAVWRIQQRHLNRLEISASEEEKQTHLRVGIGWGREGNLQFVQDVERWLAKVLEANEALGVYPVAAFRQVIAERWWYACLGAASAGRGTWTRFRTSRLLHSARVSPLQRGKLALKCSMARISA